MVHFCQYSSQIIAQKLIGGGWCVDHCRGDSDGAAIDEFAANFFHLSSAAAVSGEAKLARQYAAFAQHLMIGRHTSGPASAPAIDCAEARCAQALLAFSEDGNLSDIAELPLVSSIQFRDSGWNGRTALAFLRQHWTDTTASWLAIKASNGQANHNDVDAGSFVLDMLGKRWAEDLGADS